MTIDSFQTFFIIYIMSLWSFPGVIVLVYATVKYARLGWLWANFRFSQNLKRMSINQTQGERNEP